MGNSQWGIINWILERTLGFKLFWIEGGPWIAKFSVAFVGMLGGISTNFIFFLAGLAGIPEHLYDAAKIDGANWWQQFRHVTLPQLRPMLLLVVILETNRGIKLFAPAQLLTQGGPQGATETVVLRLYREAFTNLRLGYAAAIGVLLTIFLAILMITEYVIGDEDVQ
jgi:ABC-type sugar transport system permease subunit